MLLSFIRKYRCANGRVPFDEWLTSLKDIRDKARILRRMDKIQHGSVGDWRSVGEGVFELREHMHKGFRIYYGMESQTVILVLCGAINPLRTEISGKQRNFERIQSRL